MENFKKCKVKKCERSSLLKDNGHNGFCMNKQDAIDARRQTEKKYFGEFAYQYNN